MDVDEDPDATNFQPSNVQDYGIQIDFDDLDEDLREVSAFLTDILDGKVPTADYQCRVITASLTTSYRRRSRH